MDCTNAQKPITTDLRRWFDQHMRLMADDELREGFGNLCDAIDAVQANLECENDALYAENDAMRHERDEGLMELPLDADGEPIHVGDKLVGEKVGGGYCEPFVVIGYVMSNSVIEPMDEHKMPRMAKYAHHAPDTWERIIEDAIGEGMARELSNHNGGYDRSDSLSNAFLVARCRALAGEAE